MKKTAIGHIACPTCDHADAEVKEDKNGHAFIFCPDCNQQLFTRGDHRDAKLRKKMRPVTVTVTAPPVAVPTVSLPVPDPNTPPKAAAPKPAPAPAEKPAPAMPAAKKASWFTPLLGVE
jgi:hypothetical protein